jgi:hypothetical protein
MKRVFLSFADEDAQKVKRLITLLYSPDYDLDFYDGPLGIDIDTEDANAIKQAIGEKIVKCSVTVCLIGENTHKSKWVDSELQKSRHKGNKIIAMALKRVKEAVLPSVIREEYLTFYPWDPQKLRKLILEETPRIFMNSL